MEKRLFLAIILCLLVMLGWSKLISKIYHIENKEVTTKIPPLPPVETPSISLSPAQEPLLSPVEWKFSVEKFELIFLESSAAIKELVFKAYQAYRFPLKYGFLLRDKDLEFRKESVSPEAVVFVHRDKQKQITKRFIFSKSNYAIDLEIEVQNLSDLSLNFNPGLVLGVLNFGDKPTQAHYQDVTVALKDKILHLNPRQDKVFAETRFLGLRDRYFCAIIEPIQEARSSFIKKISPQETEIGLSSVEFVLGPGEQKVEKFRIYLGPQDLKLINHIKPEWSGIVHYGTFDFISHLLVQFLGFLQRLVHNWGLAIVLLSILIYLLLYPLSLKQMSAMKRMQELQPRIEELRTLYKDKPQKLNKEIMELYRTHKVNPFGGCLPLILQIPIFFALYQALIRSLALKGSKFLWIKDLSEPDRLFILPVSLPVLGNEINLLPILMTIGMFIQQKTSLKTTSSGSLEQQKLMLILFPLMFGFIFYRMPSGLVLYWFINSTLMLVNQLRVSRIR